MPISVEDINERIREQRNQDPTSPVRKDFETDEDFQEAMSGWSHRDMVLKTFSGMVGRSCELLV